MGAAHDGTGASRRQGRYVLGELLGRGGMAEVFAGHAHGSHGFQKPVAIKRLLPELANDHVFVERLIGEAKLLISLQHGNIVSVLDLARDGDDVFLVMEFVDGPSLRGLLKGRGARGIPFGVASYIIQSAAAGLEFAHARPGGAIIHADVSPSNILLSTSGEVRVADFGIARREGGGNGIVEGKWAYMAPEQARGEPLAPRSDVFALGVVLYELITGQHPLGRTVTADERDSGPIRVVPPRHVNPAVPPGLDAICMKALAENARDRYPRMQNLIDAIVDERFANGWREGANELAGLIREITTGVSQPAVAPAPRTQHTDRPLTIITRSLISESMRKSLTKFPVEDTLDSAETEETIEPTRMVQTRVSAQVLDVPALLAQMPQLPAQAMAAAELASVHGGHTVTSGAAAIDMRDTRSMKWTFGVLGMAALVGAIAAVAITVAPSGSTSTAQAAPQPRPVAAPIVAPQPQAQPAPPPAPITPPPTVAEVAPPPAPVVEQAAEEEPVVVEPSKPRKARVAARPAVKSGGDKVLRIETYGAVWAWAYVGGQRMDAPGAKFRLAAGTYTVRLKNTDLGVTRTCKVTVGEHDVTTLKVDMEEGGCEVF